MLAAPVQEVEVEPVGAELRSASASSQAATAPSARRCADRPWRPGTPSSRRSRRSSSPTSRSRPSPYILGGGVDQCHAGGRGPGAARRSPAPGGADPRPSSRCRGRGPARLPIGHANGLHRHTSVVSGASIAGHGRHGAIAVRSSQRRRRAEPVTAAGECPHCRTTMPAPATTTAERMIHATSSSAPVPPAAIFWRTVAAAGRDVTFLIRPKRAAEIARNGFLSSSTLGARRVSSRRSSPPRR